LPKATAHRILHALVKHDFLRKDDLSKVYRLGPALLTLGANSLQQWDIRSIARPYLERLAQTTHETVTLNVLYKDKAICLDTIEGDRSASFVVRVGRESEFHCSAAGKAILAYQPEEQIRQVLRSASLPKCTQRTITDIEELVSHYALVRHQGYAVCDGELEVGVRAIAVPVRQEDTQVIGSVTIVAPAERLDAEGREQLLPPLQQTARQISLQLAPWVPSLGEW
jgi:DNA-binding IclR family transcriptional regulator